jgi:hypothetical protein
VERKRCKEPLSSWDETRHSDTKKCCVAGRGVVSGPETQSNIETLLTFSMR